MSAGLYRTIAAIGALLAASGHASAAEGACDRVAKAMLAINDQPSVRQVVDLNDKQSGPTSILLKDAMYLKEDDSKAWFKVPVDAAQRRTIAEAGLKSLPLTDCAAEGSQTLDGVAVDVFSYSQSNPLSGGAKDAARILIGASDGLPRRMEMPGGSSMTFEYGDFKAPTP